MQDQRFQDTPWLSDVLSLVGGTGAAKFMCTCRAVRDSRFFGSAGAVAASCWKELVLHSYVALPAAKIGVSLEKEERNAILRNVQKKVLAKAISQGKISPPHGCEEWTHIGATRIRCSVCSIRGHREEKHSFYRHSRTQSPVYVCSVCLLEQQPLPPAQFLTALGI